jgi:LuxR family maltose regulon positive regulatory protein
MTRLNEGVQRKLTLVSAPAGFGKTTLVVEWLTDLRLQTSDFRLAWLSLDEADNDPARFLTYVVAALQRIQPDLGQDALRILQVPQPPSVESVLTTLLNDIADNSGPFILVLDDYHVITAPTIDHALTFVLDNIPPQMHLVIVTREDPHLPLHRLRAEDQLTELRAADLRFTHAEAARFLTQVMGLQLLERDIAALEHRTEGWIVGLQLAALSMQGIADNTQFIQTFAGSHRFVLDYLLEEVLHRQSASVQHFLLHTSILEKMCGPLCDAVLDESMAAGQTTLTSLEHANLFIIPLDNERRWYRYHHLFADLLQQRLRQSATESDINALHVRASEWFEANDLDLEAFQHAAAANDIDRAVRLIDNKGILLHVRGAVTTVLNWLASLPTAVFQTRPLLWWRHASLLLVNGHTTGVEEKLNAAESALLSATAGGVGDKTRNLLGQIAAARATLALTRYQGDVMLAQSRRALELLDADRLATRSNALWTMGYAHILQKDFVAARHAYIEAIALSKKAGAVFSTILATTGLANVQEADNQLHAAAETYRHILQLAGDQPLQIIYDAHLGLARVLYEWNDLDAAQHHGEHSLHLAQQYESVIDRFIVCEVFLARVKLARGDVTGAAAALAQAEQSARQRNFVLRLPEVAVAQVLVLLRQGRLSEAHHLAQTHALLLSDAQVYLAQGDAAAAIAQLDVADQQPQSLNDRLNALVLRAVALHLQGEDNKALDQLRVVLTQTEPEGFIRLFIDQGLPMAHLLREAIARGVMPDYIGNLLAAFDAEPQQGEHKSTQTLIEPLSPRELEVLQLIAQGLSNNDISAKLFLALDTVKGHNRKIFEKLGVGRRTEAVARARALGLL